MRDANDDDEENGSPCSALLCSALLCPPPPPPPSAANENRSANVDSSTCGACTRVNKQRDLRRQARE